MKTTQVIAKNMNHWLLIIHGDVEPELKGPYFMADEIIRQAKNHRASDPGMKDGLYSVSLNPTTLALSVEAFAGSDLN